MPRLPVCQAAMVFRIRGLRVTSGMDRRSQRQDLVAPDTQAARDALRGWVREYAGTVRLVPPLTLAEIEGHADRVLAQHAISTGLRGFVSVLLGNESWRATLAATPFERRILLLPQCLRSSTRCQASVDALGLLCKACGECAIAGIQDEAESLGYVVLVAEGSTAVSHLLSRGEADAVVGVSCLHALERSFEPLTTYAVPGMAVPLIRNGCSDTEVDIVWLREIMHLRDERLPFRRLDIKALQREISEWFAPGPLKRFIGASATQTDAIATDWLAKGGKRWRPLLTVCVYQALQDREPRALPALQQVALAVECFHKASLVHDDIEDDDDIRYEGETLHRTHGIPIALNTGDLLIGDGYRLLAGCGLPAAQVQQMIAVAAEGHRRLCLGQGEELLLARAPRPAPSAHILDVFRNKTVPAFEVALQLGAICAGADVRTREILSAYSDGLGMAYQVQDDLEDEHEGPQDSAERRPSLLAALARESGIEDAGMRNANARRGMQELARRFEAQALQSLTTLPSASLKALLYRLAATILHPSRKS